MKSGFKPPLINKIIERGRKEMEEIIEKRDDKKEEKSKEAEDVSTFRPLINLRRKQTRRITVQVDEEIAVLADEYVEFASECFGYQVTPGEIFNEVYKAHFARDNGFKGWRAEKGIKR